MQNEFWRYFNLVGCSLQHMKLCSFIILAAFKFGIMDQIRQIKVITKISAYTVLAITELLCVEITYTIVILTYKKS